MLDQLQDFLADAEHVTFKVLATIAILLVAYLLRLGTRFVARRFTTKERYVARVTRVLTAIVTVLATIAVLLVWFSVSNAILIALVVAGAVVFLSMKDLVTDVFGFSISPLSSRFAWAIASKSAIPAARSTPQGS